MAIETYEPLSRLTSNIFLAALVAFVGTFLGYQLWVGGRTMSGRLEGFAGPVKGAGVPDCTRTSQEAAQLIALFSMKQSTTGEGADDLRELSVLVGKLACFKRDLMSPAKQVQATYRQPFATSHDMEPIAETTARCFAKTIPQRDLQLSFDKWSKRGTMLIKRLCTSYSLSSAETQQARKLFDVAMADFSSVALSVCCGGNGEQSGPRVLGGLEPPGLSFHMDYKGYY